MLSVTNEPVTDNEIMELFNRASIKIVHNKEEIPNKIIVFHIEKGAEKIGPFFKFLWKSLL